jgi:hypothetical protein
MFKVKCRKVAIAVKNAWPVFLFFMIVAALLSLYLVDGAAHPFWETMKLRALFVLVVLCQVLVLIVIKGLVDRRIATVEEVTQFGKIKLLGVIPDASIDPHARKAAMKDRMNADGLDGFGDAAHADQEDEEAKKKAKKEKVTETGKDQTAIAAASSSSQGVLTAVD